MKIARFTYNQLVSKPSHSPLSKKANSSSASASLANASTPTRLVALNHERAAEEKRGLIRYLRPDYQAPGAAIAQQSEIGLPGEDAATPAASAVILDWPAELPAQVAALRKLLPTVGQDPEPLAACFGRKSQKRTAQITAILETLKALGHIT